MNIRFENGDIPIWKVKPGTVVSQNGYFYHIANFSPLYKGLDDLNIVIYNNLETLEVNPRYVEWLEPF